MTAERVDNLNVGLMVASLAAAFALPFELFLISYAVLGPLHYLTELSWLHDRGYFAEHRAECVGLAGLVLLVVFTSGFIPALTVPALASWRAELPLLGLGLALIAVLARSTRARLLGVAALLCGAVGVHWLLPVSEPTQSALTVSIYEIFFTLYLTTIVHVFVFTGAFILHGALKNRSRSGIRSFCVFLTCAGVCLLAPSSGADRPGDDIVGAYDMTSTTLLAYLVHHLPFFETLPSPEAVFEAPAAVQVGRFIAWAYTYHYLNWFSKTSVIRWHEVPRWRYVAVGILWLASLGLYAHDYLEGLRWLLMLSLLHVFMEFPLNWRSFIGIGSELRGVARARQP